MKFTMGIIPASLLCALLIACGDNANSNANSQANSNAGDKKASAISTSNANSAQSQMNTSANLPGSAEVANDKAITPEDAAKRLYAAWRKNDRNAAALVAAPTAVNELFKTGRVGPEAPEWEFSPCEKSKNGFDCGYFYEGGGVNMRVEGSSEQGYRVISLKFVAD